ncbi:unnamed protein product [Effrenium voratum]|uniref:Endonuclease/exonuclease/phosphatase domain-containing protein n=1 Tax=Effrenium voratum TaxID=2562239 RepID=A0AA36NAM7_9DINO|nr:unnamed protein product [Effrenium voratum]
MASLCRRWISAQSPAPAGRRLRVLHWNILADCLAKSSSLLSLTRGFRCEEQVLRWEVRRQKVLEELLRYEPDVMGLCEVDHFEDFFEPELKAKGYQGTFKRKRSPAKDGVCAFWRSRKLEEGVRRGVFLEYGRHRTKAAQVAVLQRLWPTDRQQGKGLVVCATHLRASADEGFRMQQASEVVSALADFARGDEQIILADVNSHAKSAKGMDLNVHDYFRSCGFRCAYRSISDEIPSFTTWAGWASGDFKATCDHIFVSQGIHVSQVLDVPDSEALEHNFPETGMLNLFRMESGVL